MSCNNQAAMTATWITLIVTTQCQHIDVSVAARYTGMSIELWNVVFGTNCLKINEDKKARCKEKAYSICTLCPFSDANQPLQSWFYTAGTLWSARSRPFIYFIDSKRARYQLLNYFCTRAYCIAHCSVDCQAFMYRFLIRCILPIKTLLQKLSEKTNCEIACRALWALCMLETYDV